MLTEIGRALGDVLRGGAIGDAGDRNNRDKGQYALVLHHHAPKRSTKLTKADRGCDAGRACTTWLCSLGERLGSQPRERLVLQWETTKIADLPGGIRSRT